MKAPHRRNELHQMMFQERHLTLDKFKSSVSAMDKTMRTSMSDYDEFSEVPCRDCMSMAVKKGPGNKHGYFEFGKDHSFQGDPQVPDDGKLHKNLHLRTV